MRPLKHLAAPTTKTIHLISAGTWVGCLVAAAAGSLAARSLGDRDSFAAVYVVFRLVDRVLPWTWYATIGTGLVFSLHLKWGFLRHKWIAVKWVLGTALIGSALFWQGPLVAVLAAHADLEQASWVRSNEQALTAALVLIGLVVILFVISTFKPWGRFAREWHPPRVRTIAIVWAVTVLVAGVSLVQSCQLERLRAMTIEPVAVDDVRDGEHRGRASPDGFSYEVAITVLQGRIVRAVAVGNRSGLYPRLAEGVLRRVVDRQTVAVDAITGATTTSKCLLAAARRALADAPRR